MNPKVLILGLNYAPEPTGIAPYTAGLAVGLMRRGLDVSVLTSHPHYPQWRVLDTAGNKTTHEVRDGVPVTRVAHYVPRNPTGMRRAASEISFGVRTASARWPQPDLVICPSPALLGIAVVQAFLAVRGRSRPALGIVVQDLYSAGMTESKSHSERVTSTLSRLEGRVLRRADGLAVIHSRFKDRLVADFDIPPEDVEVIRNWTHVASAPDDFNRAGIRASHGSTTDDFVVLHTGAMGEKQGLENVLETARLACRLSSPIRFILVGDGGQRRRLESKSKDLPNVAFISPVAADQYPALLASADVLLVNERPGLIDMSVPSKLTSYFSSGVPVLAASAIDSATWSEVRDAGAGIRVDPGVPQLLLDGITGLMVDSAKADALGARGPEYCKNVLSEKVSLDAYADWSLRLLAARGRGA